MLSKLPKILKNQAQAFCRFPAQSSIPWHRLLTRRLNARTKLVGPVISCEGAPFKGQAPSKWRDSPAVQSYAIALDQVNDAQLSAHPHWPSVLAFTQDAIHWM